MIKTIIISVLVSLCSLSANANEKEGLVEKLSLPEATVVVGLPAVAITAIIFSFEFNHTPSKSFRNFKHGFKPPIWDKNPWHVNYIGHPEFGAEAYLLARNRDCSIFASFLYSTAASIIWEYGIESWTGANPSTQDLIVTPIVGSLFGELRYIVKNMLIDNDDLVSKTFVVILDPMDAYVGLFE